MNSDDVPVVAVKLPAELVAQLGELKKDREQDRLKSVEDLIAEFCSTYIEVRKMARWEQAHKDEITRSYEEKPTDRDEDEAWARAYPLREDSNQ